MNLVRKFETIDKTVTLIGESGTGKSSLARQLHRVSKRSHSKFLQVNILSIASTLFESELFGHTKGSFTGAVTNKRGFFEEVGSGTLFLDEIGGLQLELQSKLLMVLEEGFFYPVGSTQKRPFEGRLLFASSTPLVELLDTKRLRSDFYYRIKNFTLTLPSLRSHPDRESIITKSFLDKKLQNNNFSVYLDAEAKQELIQYSYMGNFRELHGIMDYITTMYTDVVYPCDLPLTKRSQGPSDKYYDALENFEREFLNEKLAKCHGGINQTARLVGISKVTLISKIKKYDINIDNIKARIQEVV